jgi:hypothetical protein
MHDRVGCRRRAAGGAPSPETLLTLLPAAWISMTARTQTTTSTPRAIWSATAKRRPGPVVGVAVVVAVALIALVVVSASRSRSGSASGSHAALVSAAPGGGSVGRRVTPFRLVSLGGQSVALPTVGRPGVLFFSESSCSSCIPSAQALSSVKARLGSRVDAVMVDLDPGDSRAYLAAWGRAVGNPSYPLAIDTTGQLASA